MAKARVFRGDPEHKQVALFDNFLGGLNTTEIDEQTRTNEFRELENVELIEEGRIQKRMGWGSAKRLNEAIFDNLDFENIYYFGVIKDEKNVLDRLDTFQGDFELTVDMIIGTTEIGTISNTVIKYKVIKLKRTRTELIETEELNETIIYSQEDRGDFKLVETKINQIDVLNYSGRKIFLLNQIVKDSEDIVEFYINDQNEVIVNVFNKNNSYTPNAYETKNVGYNLLKEDPLSVYTDNTGVGGITSVLITDYIENTNLISKNIYNTIVNTEKFGIRVLFTGADSFFTGMELKFYYLSGTEKVYVYAKVEDLGTIKGWKYYNISEIASFPRDEELVFEFIKVSNATTIEEHNSIEDLFDVYYNKTEFNEKKTYLKPAQNDKFHPMIAHETDPFRYVNLKLNGAVKPNGVYGAYFTNYSYVNNETSKGILFNSKLGIYPQDIIKISDTTSLMEFYSVHQRQNYLVSNVPMTLYDTEDYMYPMNLVSGQKLEYSFALNPKHLPFPNDFNIRPQDVTYINFTEGIFTEEDAIPISKPYTPQKFETWLKQSGLLSQSKFSAESLRNINIPAIKIIYVMEETGHYEYELTFRLYMEPSSENKKPLQVNNYLNGTLEVGEIFKIGDKYYEYNGSTAEYVGSNKSDYFSEVQRPDVIYEYLIPFEVRNSEPIEINPISFKNAKAIIIDDRLVLYGDNTIVYSDIFSTAKNNIEQSFSYFPNYNTITLNLSSSDEIQKIAYYRGSHIIFTKECIYRLGGVLNTDTMEVVIINDTIGCISAGSVRSLNNTIVFLTVDGLYSLRQNYYQDGLENVLKIDTKIKGVIPYGTNYESIVVNEQYLLHIKDVEGNYIKTLKQYYNMVNSSRELPYTVDVYREAPNTVFKIMGNMFGFHNNQIYMYGVGFTDFMSKEILPDLKDEYAYPIKILTANWDLSHPIHEKKFKNLFIKLSSSSIVGIYFKIKVDKSVTTDSTQYLVEMNSRGELEYKIIRDPNINTFHTALVSSSNMTLGAGVLGQSYLGDVRYQVHKVAPAVKGRVIQLYFENNTADRLAIDSISLVYKLGKMRESV